MDLRRVDWLLSGLNRDRLNRGELGSVRHVENLLRQGQGIAERMIKRLEDIYRRKGR